MFLIKFDFIRIVCNHEHYISFCLPIRKAVSNINEYAEMKHEFVLSDHFRHLHFLVGVLLSQLCLSLNENKEQRKLAINAFRNVLCKHSHDNRYNTDKVIYIFIFFLNIINSYLFLIDKNGSYIVFVLTINRYTH